MKRILVERGEVTRMSKLFGCTGQTVRNALRGLAESELTDRIRADALKAGGVEKPKRRVIKETVSESDFGKSVIKAFGK